MVGIRLFKSWRLNHIYCFLKNSIKECIIHIQLEKIPMISDGQSDDESNGDRFHHQRKCLIKIKPLNLMKSLSYQSSFISVNRSICILFNSIPVSRSSNLASWTYFLGIEVRTLKDYSLVLTQSKYIRDLLQKTKMTNAQLISSPKVTNCKLTKSGADLFSDPTFYRFVIGALQYTTITRPERSGQQSKRFVSLCQTLWNNIGWQLNGF